MAMMEGEEINLEYFKELTNLERVSFYEVLKQLDEMINDLHLKCSLERLEETITTSSTKYEISRYKLVSRLNYKFILPEDLEENKRILYFPTIVYLKLKNRQYVSFKDLQLYFPNFNKDISSKFFKKMKQLFGEDIYKDELQSYVLDDGE